MEMVTLSVRTNSSAEFIDITDKVRKVVTESGIKDGICLVFVPHTTAGVTINESADPDVRRDILRELSKIVPQEDGYLHAEGNSAAHIKTLLTGTSVTIPVRNGSPVLGTWQSVYFCEYDGPRQRSIHIQMNG